MTPPPHSNKPYLCLLFVVGMVLHAPRAAAQGSTDPPPPPGSTASAPGEEVDVTDAGSSDAGAVHPEPELPESPGEGRAPRAVESEADVRRVDATEASAPAPEAKVVNAALAEDGHPLAGWHDGLFYLRDARDDFRLHINGRAQIDLYAYAGRGIAETTLVPTLLVRRVRPELSGQILKRWWFMIAGDFGATALDNPRGTTETSAAAPGDAPTATSGRYAPAQTPRFNAAATDVFVGYTADPLFNVQVGQFNSNFMMENLTSDKYTAFLERSLAVRVVGAPLNKQIGVMAWGTPRDRPWYWSLGLYNGDGANRLNADARGDVLARGWIRPLSGRTAASIKGLQVGASFRYGSRDRKRVYWDYPAMTTQGNYMFWSPTYAGSNGFTHILPAGGQLGIAGELRVPVWRFDVTGEVVYVDNGTREAREGFQAAPASERLGSMEGIAYYAQLGFWAFGERDINGIPGDSFPPRVDFDKPAPRTSPTALQLLAKWEKIALTYTSASRAGTVDTRNVDGDIVVNALSVGVNYWATKHVRLSANYVLDMFPDSAPVTPTAPGRPVQTAANRALAPPNTLAPGVNDSARDEVHSLSELLFRVAVGF